MADPAPMQEAALRFARARVRERQAHEAHRAAVRTCLSALRAYEAAASAYVEGLVVEIERGGVNGGA